MVDGEVKLLLFQFLDLPDEVGQRLVSTLVRRGTRGEFENESRQILELGSRLGDYDLIGFLKKWNEITKHRIGALRDNILIKIKIQVSLGQSAKIHIKTQCNQAMPPLLDEVVVNDLWRNKHGIKP